MLFAKQPWVGREAPLLFSIFYLLLASLGELPASYYEHRFPVCCKSKIRT